MARNKYPKPLIFHDGRLAFLPTPASMLVLFLWLPLAPALAAFRILIGLLPYNLSLILAALSGITFRVQGLPTAKTKTKTNGVLYVCNHRTLLDPVMLTNAIQRPVPAVTYSVSRTSELLSPIRTVRLTRDRARDGQKMRALLRAGDLVVCPEGTTCREPYLLRFSSLFVELADEIVPVAMDCKGIMFYGTTATGHKCLDPVMFMMNAVVEYRVHLLGPLEPQRMMMSGGRSEAEVANEVQRRLGEALGFECTALTRREKYLMLAGHEGVVRAGREVEGKC